MLSHTVKCWLFSTCVRFIRHVSSCQPPAVCICVHLANSQEIPPPRECSLLGSSETNFEQLLFLLILIVWCSKKKGVSFPPKVSDTFCHIISHPILMHQKQQQKKEGINYAVHTQIMSYWWTPTHLFTISLPLFYLYYMYSSIKGIPTTSATLQLTLLNLFELSARISVPSPFHCHPRGELSDTWKKRMQGMKPWSTECLQASRGKGESSQ